MPENTSNKMDIKELYKLYQQHPCITTDSRNCPEGSIFLALKGASFDGNLYAVQALEKGCSYAIIDNQDVLKELSQLSKLSSRIILVDDCLQTYKDLAREHRRQFDIPVIGITGTNGKTTTKELIRAVLSECYNVMATEGNFNNDVGGRAHLQGFGSFEGVCKTKGELYDFLSAHDCPVFINRDNKHLMQMIQERNTQKTARGEKPLDIYYYGLGDSQDILIRGEVISCAPFLKFRWREQDHEAGYTSEWMEVQTHLIGAYNVDNMLAAITIGYVNNVPFKQINHALENYVPTNNRSQLTETEKNHLIVDAYNANPTSMKAALDNFRMMEVSPKMAILGKMGELGDVSDEEHQKIIKQLEEARFDEVWLVGEEFQKALCAQPSSLTTLKVFHDVEEVKALIAQQQPQGRYILIKGSNSTHLYELPVLL